MTLTAEVAADRDALGEQTRERLRIAQAAIRTSETEFMSRS